MQVVIEKIIYGGKGFARLDGKVVFLDGGIPGELVEAEVVKDKKDYIEARTVRIESPSPHRVSERCAHYRICSPYQCIEYPFQLKIKEEQVREALRRFPGAKDYKIFVRSAEQIWNYRNKVALHVLWENGKAFLAYHRSRSHEKFVKIEECFLVSKEINNLLGLVKDVIEVNSLFFIEEIMVRGSGEKKEFLVVLYGTGDLVPEKVKGKFPDGNIVYINNENHRRQTIAGKPFIEERIDEKLFRIGPESFFQINMEMLNLLIRDLKEALKLKGAERIADLYAGCGLFSIIAAPSALEVRAVESAKENIMFFKKNIDLNESGNVTIFEGSCEDWIEEVLSSPVDILIADPPRKGLSDRVLDEITKKKPKTVVYISCDLSTLARDLKRLFPHYGIEEAYIYDFFPHTAHIETLIVLRSVTT